MFNVILKFVPHTVKKKKLGGSSVWDSFIQAEEIWGKAEYFQHRDAYWNANAVLEKEKGSICSRYMTSPPKTL